MDKADARRFTGRARLEKSLNSLIGIIEGVAIDGVINSREVVFLADWLGEQADVAQRHPYNELMPVLEEALADGVLSDGEREDILWLCRKMHAAEYFDEVTADMQRLHAVLGAILADGVVTVAEMAGLSAWLAEHEHLRRCWPYDEIHSLVVGVMADGRIDAAEQQMLRGFFAEFIAFLDDRTITSPPVELGGEIVGLCAVCPEIELAGRVFCFTGTSSRYSRRELADMVQTAGGVFTNSVSKKVDYLIIGADGNPAWAYACYGRKVEQAVKLRKAGQKILLVHENDFRDALAGG